MKHPPVTHGLDQATLVSAEAWEQFFTMVREYSNLARQRRAAATVPATVAVQQEDMDERSENRASPPLTGRTPESQRTAGGTRIILPPALPEIGSQAEYISTRTCIRRKAGVPSAPTGGGRQRKEA
jgi:hypothetical protein